MTENSRKRKTKNPCPICKLREDLCICALIKPIHTSTRLTLIVHYKELKRTTNSGALAVRMLINSELIIRGANLLNSSDSQLIENAKIPKIAQENYNQLLVEGYRQLYFFPTAQAEELTIELVERDSRPIQLIVPDGNWRQASKVWGRHPELHHMEQVKITSPNLEKHHLRKEHSEFGMSTLEAIAKAFGFTEREAEGEKIKAQLLELYHAKLNATLKGRGVI